MAIVKIETLEDKYELMNHLPMNETKIKLFQYFSGYLITL